MKWKLCFLSVLLSSILAGCESTPQSLPEDKVNNEQPSKVPDSETITSTPEPTIEQKPVIIEEKEIVFLNHAIVYANGDIDLNQFNVVESLYEPQTSETLYAFCIAFENFLDEQYEMPEDYPIQKEYETDVEWSIKEKDFWTNEALKIIEDTDLILLSDYPYCHYNQKKLTHPYHDSQTLRLGLCAVAGTLDEIKELFDRTSSFEGLCLAIRSAPRPDLLEKMRKAGWRGFYPMSWFEMNEEKIRPLIGNEKQVTQIVEIKTEVK